jgi:predicted dehydrogenase
MHKPVRLGISGFGRLAQNYYVPALRRLGDVSAVVAVADPFPASREAARRLLPQAQVFETQSQMLDAVPLDGLLVASPPSAHLDAWNDAAARDGLAVFMEKPFVLPGELDRLHSSPDVSRRLMVNFNRRFWPRYQQLGEIAPSGRIGEIQRVELELQVDVSKWLSITQHRVEKGQGGALYDLGSQMIDLAGVILGQHPTAVAVSATSTRWEADHLDVRLTFPRAADVLCKLAYDAPTRERVHIRGTNGEVRINNPNMTLRVGGSMLGNIRDVFTFAGHAARRHTSMSRLTIELALRSFLKGPPFSPGFEDARFNAIALEAAKRSLESGHAESIGAS